MSVELLPLGPAAALAAPGLCRSRHIHLDLGPAGGLPPLPFLRGPAAIAFWASTSAAVPLHIERQLGLLEERGIELALYDVASFGFNRLVEEIYFPIFVRFSYCTGVAPFPVNLDNFRLLADPGALLAVASVQGAAVAAALLRPAVKGDMPHREAPAAVDQDEVLEIAAMGTTLLVPSFDDVFFCAVLGMLSAQEYQYVWVREKPWVTSSRAAHWTKNARRADYVAYQPSLRDCYAWNPELLESGESVLFLESCGPEARLLCHVIGDDRDKFTEARRALLSRGVGCQYGPQASSNVSRAEPDRSD